MKNTTSTKLYDLLESIMSEVGENTAEPYAASRSEIERDFEVHYTFTAENGVHYVLQIIKDSNYKDFGSETKEFVYFVAFGTASEEEYEDWGDEAIDFNVTSKAGKEKVGNMRRVLATVIEYVNREMEIDKKRYIQVTKVMLYPSKESKTDERRANIYKRYIEKNMPAGSKVKYNQGSNAISVDLPNPNPKKARTTKLLYPPF